MGKAFKIWLIIATLLVVAGGILFVIGMTEKKWDFNKLSTEEFETNISLVSEEFSKISVNVETADVSVVPVEDVGCKIIFYEQAKVKHLATVDDETLTISVVDQRQWYDKVGISVSSPRILIYLPEKDYESLYIESSTGDITLQNMTVGNINLSVSTGDINVSSVDCEGSFKTEGSTGKLNLSNVMVKETLSVERSTGDVEFESCDAGEILINTSTGNVNGTLLSEKIFFAQTSTGKVNVPKTTTGGKCEINTSTGNINVEIRQ